MNKQQMRFEAAKAAMQGYLSCDTFAKSAPIASGKSGIPIHVGIAQMAVQQADALLAELAAKEVEASSAGGIPEGDGCQRCGPCRRLDFKNCRNGA